MITKIEINGFKSFEGFQMSFSPFVVVAGTNASGKSNLFDAIRLLSALADKDLKTAFAKQRGSYLELFTQYSKKLYSPKIELSIDLFLDRYVSDDFNKEVELGHRRLRYEIVIERITDRRLNIEKLVVKRELLRPIKRAEDQWYKQVISGTKWEPLKKSLNYKPYISTEIKSGVNVIHLRQDGIRGGKPTPVKDLERSVLSGVNDASFPHAFAVKKEILNWNIFQLNPIELSKPSPMLGKNKLDVEGRNLAALVKWIEAMEPMALQSMSRKIHKLLPDIRSIEIDSDQVRQQYVLMAEGVDGRKFSSNVLSEGTLRIIALIALHHDERHRGLICFEEPENGIHPYRMRKILDVLKSLTTDFSDLEQIDLPLRQVIINTHSPLLIKEIAKSDELRDVSLYFSRLVKIVNSEKGLSYRVTRLSPVVIENTRRILFGSMPAEEAVSHHELNEFLNVFDNVLSDY